MLTTNVLTELYSPIYDEFVMMTFAEETQVNTRVFQQINDSTKTYITHGLSGLGIWVDANEAAGGGYEDPSKTYSKTFTQGKLWKKFQESFEAVDFDEYALLKKEDDIKAMGRGARAKVETDTSAVLYNGFSVASPDGQYLFSASHPKNPDETGTTYDNLLSGPLSHDNLESAEKQMSDNYKDPKGIPIVVEESPMILYPPALRGTVARIFSDRATGRPEIDNRDEVNRFAGKYTPVEWRYLAADLGGSDTAWYIIFNSMNFLKIVWSDKPSFSAWTDEDLELYKFKGRMLYDTGVTDWRCGFASTGL